MRINKYLSLDSSLHKTFYDINTYYPNTCLSYERLICILNNNWSSEGYQTRDEESLFMSYATYTMKLYSIIPLDKGTDIVLLNKFITDTEISKAKYIRIDKLHFLSDGRLELLDYKSGRYIPPINKLFSSDNISFSINSIKKKVGVYPDIFSLYFLRHGIKLSIEIISPEIN